MSQDVAAYLPSRRRASHGVRSRHRSRSTLKRHSQGVTRQLPNDITSDLQRGTTSDAPRKARERISTSLQESVDGGQQRPEGASKTQMETPLEDPTSETSAPSIVGHEAEAQGGKDLPIHIVAHRMGGDTFELDVRSDTTVAELKEHLRQKSQIPKILQVLVCEAARLIDTDSLHSFLPDSRGSCGGPEPPSLTLTLLVSVEGMRSEPQSRKIEAVDALMELGWLDALAALTEDHDSDVRLYAVEALIKAAAMGDKRVVHAVTAGLGDLSSFVRVASLKALPKVAAKGDEYVLTLISAHLSHSLAGARHSAVEALAKMTQPGDHESLGHLTSCLHDVDFGVRAAAVRALASVAEVGDGRVIGALEACAANDADRTVKTRARRALRSLRHGS